MKRGATLFSGGGGVEALLGAHVDFVHAVELDPQIAAVYRQNHGDHVQVASVCDIDYTLWGALDYLHASPVCKEFSQAKTGGKESAIDTASALAVVRCIEATQPRVFTLENVGAYQRSQSYRLICQALDQAGYMWHAEVLNSADFGVPQTRRRLILRAVRDSLLPGLAAPDPWVGWYAAIEDLIPGLPASQFAPWQIARLPECVLDSLICAGEGAGDYGITPRFAHEPIGAIKAATYKGMPRAFIMSNAATEYGDGIRSDHEPCHSITAQANGRTRAWLVPDQNNGNNRGKWVRDAEQPSMSIGASGGARAWLVHPSEMRSMSVIRDDMSAFTTLSQSNRGPFAPRAWLAQGRVVKMTPRALARFQSLPDSYILPDRAALGCTIIGNAVPSLMIKKIVEPLL